MVHYGSHVTAWVFDQDDGLIAVLLALRHPRFAEGEADAAIMKNNNREIEYEYLKLLLVAETMTCHKN